MKNKTTKAAKATQTINGQTFTVTRLKTRHARKGETHYTGAPVQGGGRVLGSVVGRGSNTANIGQASTGARWSGGNGQCGYGASATANLDKVKATYKAVVAASKRDDARHRAELRQAGYAI